MKRAIDFAARLNLLVWKALPHDAFVRAYRHAPLRRVLNLAFRRKDPIGWTFPVSCYNAGTTFIKDAITRSPKVVGMPVEGDILTSAPSSFERGGFPRGMLANRNAIELSRSSDTPTDRILITRDRVPWIRSDRQFVDKSISNRMRIPKLRTAFPSARFVCFVRSPDGVIAGIKQRSRPSNVGEYSDEIPRDQRVYFYKTILNDADDSDTSFCSYGSFVADPKDATVTLYRSLGLRQVLVEDASDGISIEGKQLSLRSRPATESLASDAKTQVLDYLQQLGTIGGNSHMPAAE